MAQKFQGVIFDLDGTLLDTLEDIADAMNRVLRHHGLPEHPVAAYRYFVGAGATELARRVLPEEQRSDDRVAELRAAFIAEYSKGWRNKTRPYPGIPELLSRLHAKGVVLGVLSNKPHDFTQLCVDTFLDGGLFAVVMGESEGVPRKPDPTGALKAADLMGIEPGRILYVGDTAIDMATAKGAGMYGVGVLWGFRDSDELLRAGARELVSEPGELERFF